jgi:hypothetical protein
MALPMRDLSEVDMMRPIEVSQRPVGLFLARSRS